MHRLFLAAIFALVATGAHAADKLRFVQSSWGLIFAPVMAADDLGRLAEAGIEAEFITNLGGAEALAAVIGGNAEVYVGAPASALRARERGTDVVVFAPVITQYASNIVVAREWAAKFGVTAASPYADKLKALRGITIGVVGLGSGTHQLVQFLAKQAGLDPNRDMTVLNLPEAQAQLAAFKQRRTQGFSFSSPTSDIAMRDDDGMMLFHTTKGEVKPLDGFLYTTLISRESWLQKNEDLSLRLLRALQSTLDDLQDPARSALARDRLHAKHHRSVDKPFFDQLWADTVPAFPRSVEITPEMAARVLAFLTEFSDKPYDKALATTGFDSTRAKKALTP